MCPVSPRPALVLRVTTTPVTPAGPPDSRLASRPAAHQACRGPEQAGHGQARRGGGDLTLGSADHRIGQGITVLERPGRTGGPHDVE